MAETKEELWEEIRRGIDQKGFGYYFREYTSPEYSGADRLDPELAKMWREYLALADRMQDHIEPEWSKRKKKSRKRKNPEGQLKNRLLR